MLRQAIDLPGVGNARELGGYAIGGRTIKHGILLRTAKLASARPEAIEKLQNRYRLQTVVDLRMNDEHSYVPDPVIPGSTTKHLSVIEIEDYPIPEDIDPSVMDKTFALLKNPKANRMEIFDTAYMYGMIGSNSYEFFLLGERGKKAYAGFFRALLELDEDRAILWHCTDGKDRTGCASMLLLSALGASRTLILDDYLLTNEYNSAVVEKVEQIAAALPIPQDKRDALMFMSGCVVESYIVHILDLLEERYGSVVGYLQEELGLSEAERQKLKDLFFD